MSPLHPAIVHFPIALIVLSVIAEIVGFFRPSPAARAVAWWSLVGALIGAGLAIWAGYFDMDRASLAEPTHELVHQHLKIGWILGGSFFGLTIWKWFSHRKANADVATGSGVGYLAVLILVVCLTFFQGWYGGEMAYAHGAGMAAAGQGMETPEKARERIIPVHEFLDKIPLFSDEHENPSHSH